MAAVLRMVHPSELLNCSCERPAKPLSWVDEEEKPRCFECLKPVQEFSRLEERLDRARARWRCFYLRLLDIMQFDDSPRLWEGGFCCGIANCHHKRCDPTGLVIATTVFALGVIRLVW